jgi:hypothetical protein
VDGDEGIATIKGPGEELIQLEGVQVLLQRIVFFGDFLPGVHAAIFLGEIDEHREFLQTLGQRFQGLQDALDLPGAPGDFAGIVGIVPELWLGLADFQFRQFGIQFPEVKETS